MELVEIIAGLRIPDRGRIVLVNRDISQSTVSAPGSRPGSPISRSIAPNISLVPGMTVEDNLALREFNRAPLSRWCCSIARFSRACEPAHGSSLTCGPSGPDAPARTLSGGNQQKIVVAREIGRDPKVLIAVQPTWGLDPARPDRYRSMLALREAGEQSFTSLRSLMKC